MSQMPDKIWLHKDTKYNTGDIVCGYQYEFAEGIDDEGGIENFVEYVPIDAFIDKACKWLEEHSYKYMKYNEGLEFTEIIYDWSELVDNLKKYMEE